MNLNTALKCGTNQWTGKKRGPYMAKNSERTERGELTGEWKLLLRKVKGYIHFIFSVTENNCTTF